MPRKKTNPKLEWLPEEEPYPIRPAPARVRKIDSKVPRAEPNPETGKRWLREEAMNIAKWYAEDMAFFGLRTAFAGSYRRGKPDVGDMDILWIPREGVNPLQVHGHEMERARTIYAAGADRCSFLTSEGLQIDIVATSEESWGACLQYFTGSRDHNISLRAIAKRRGLVLNEYGLFKGSMKPGWGEADRIAGQHEGGIYKALGLRWLPPRYREGPLRHTSRR